ncbi:CIA30 family protein [Aureibaculum sp. 2210JD6-5]|uniref:CIA30 family protein n=1 Tax=Aureibaculum sp. 2210JD6-5 TaxID=3103957 RepID=UPI002AAC97E0|nr:CIA30 family protein [Aureibaculum sp. 2210JD6-5]MDY7395449.1 CIA30 family protein [Aureibaculum sp. 2210JD6-5]
MQIFDFNNNSDISDWQITNDDVMGGKSSGQFVLDGNGNGVFKGEVSLENNGGFSSVKYKFEPKSIEDNTRVVLKLKGDGKTYQFRVKSDTGQRHSYIYKFETTGEWETLKISLSELYPVFRGRKLDLPNFSNNKLVETAFLIANGKNESFQLKIASIGLK